MSELLQYITYPSRIPTQALVVVSVHASALINRALHISAFRQLLRLNMKFQQCASSGRVLSRTALAQHPRQPTFMTIEKTPLSLALCIKNTFREQRTATLGVEVQMLRPSCLRTRKAFMSRFTMRKRRGWYGRLTG